jgi:hypothetical protein
MYHALGLEIGKYYSQAGSFPQTFHSRRQY